MERDFIIENNTKKMAEESKAEALLQEGDRLLKRSSIWGFVDPSKKFEDAKEKFTKAANLFKLAKAWEGAGKAFEKSAEMAEKLEMPHEAISFLMDAADMYSRIDKRRAVHLYKDVATKSCEQGKFSKAAQMLDLAGALLEEDDIGAAVECYSKASDYHFSDRANSKGNKSLEKVALLSAEIGNFGDAAKIFEQLGYSALESTLLKFGAKKHFLHAGICFLAKGDVVAAQVALGRYSLADPSLKGSREFNLYEQLCNAYEKLDTDIFTQALVEYDRVMTLDSWETSVLLKVKRSIEEAAGNPDDLR